MHFNPAAAGMPGYVYIICLLF